MSAACHFFQPNFLIGAPRYSVLRSPVLPESGVRDYPQWLLYRDMVSTSSIWSEHIFIYRNCRVVRAAVSVSLVRHLLIVTSRVHMQMALSFFFIMTGIAFSASGTVVCMLGFARVQEFRHKHLPLAFIIPVISGKQ